MSLDALRVAGIIARLHKEASLTKEAAPAPITGAQLIGHGLDIIGKTPAILGAGFKRMGEKATKVIALPGREPGLVAKGVGKALEYTPHAAGLYIAGKLVTPHAAPYMRGKVRQFRSRQARTRPYFDPVTQRFI